MFSSLFEFLSKHIYKLTCGCLLRDLTQRVHSPYAYLHNPIHVIPLLTHDHLDPHILHQHLYRTQLTLIINSVFLY
jgi:hypothetical protein